MQYQRERYYVEGFGPIDGRDFANCGTAFKWANELLRMKCANAKAEGGDTLTQFVTMHRFAGKTPVNVIRVQQANELTVDKEVKE